MSVYSLLSLHLPESLGGGRQACTPKLTDVILNYFSVNQVCVGPWLHGRDVEFTEQSFEHGYVVIACGDVFSFRLICLRSVG